MDRSDPKTLLIVLLAAVPVLAAAAGVSAVLLLKSGFGLVVGLLVPILVLSLAAGGLGALLGRAASRSGRGDRGNG